MDIVANMIYSHTVHGIALVETMMKLLLRGSNRGDLTAFLAIDSSLQCLSLHHLVTPDDEALVASFPGTPTIQLLITCSMQNGGILQVTHDEGQAEKIRH